MKKLILFIAVLTMTLLGHAQENTKKQKQANNSAQETTILKDTWNGIKNAYISGEAFEDQQKFAYGFLKQGVNTVQGMYESIIEQPYAWRELRNVGDGFCDYVEFGWDFTKYIGKTTIESVVNIAGNIISGDPEKIGEAVFDGAMIYYGGKAVKYMRVKYGPKYHYAPEAASKGIINEGQVNLGKSGKVWTQPFNDLSREQAIKTSALEKGHEPYMVFRVDTKGIEPITIQKIEPNFGQPGGGIEIIYDQPLPVVSWEMVEPNTTLTTLAKQTLRESSFYTPSLSLIENNNNEGGHIINATINIEVIVKDTIKPGFFKTLDIDGIRVVYINHIDINKITPDFIKKLIGDVPNDYYYDNETPEIHDREDIIPKNMRSQRGL